MTDIAVVSYWAPFADADWQRLESGAFGAGYALINPDSGPGDPSKEFIPAIRGKLGERAETLAAIGTKPLGYISSRKTGTQDIRDADEMISEALAYFQAPAFRNSIAGIFIDEVSNIGASDPAEVAIYREVADAIRLQKPNAIVAGNMGAVVAEAERYVEDGPNGTPVFDILSVFEGALTDEFTPTGGVSYRDFKPMEWQFGYDADRFWHIIHSAPSDSGAEVAERALGKHAGVVSLTDGVFDPDNGLTNPFNPPASAEAHTPFRQGLEAAQEGVGGAFDDVLVGGASTNELFGNGGDDLLLGSDGRDRLIGGPGRDTLNGADGNDRLFGNAGVDRLVGDHGHDYLAGQSGNDVLFGNAGNDKAVGGFGRDRIVGQSGDDRLFGNAGDDRLEGGPGNDYLAGQSGADFIQTGDGFDTVLPGPGFDLTIFDDRGVLIHRGLQDASDGVAGYRAGDVQIDFSGSGFAKSTLALIEDGTDTLLQFGGIIPIRLVGVSPADVDIDDFLFA